VDAGAPKPPAERTTPPAHLRCQDAARTRFQPACVRAPSPRDAVRLRTARGREFGTDWHGRPLRPDARCLDFAAGTATTARSSPVGTAVASGGAPAGHETRRLV